MIFEKTDAAGPDICFEKAQSPQTPQASVI